MWVWILLAIAGLGALGYFVIYPWFTKDDKPKTDPKKDPDLIPIPTGVPTGGNSTNNSGGNNSGGGGSSTGNSGNTTSDVYTNNKGIKVINLDKGSKAAKLAQKLINKGCSAYGINQTLTVDGKIGPKSKAALKALTEAINAPLPFPARIFDADTLTLQGLATTVQSKVNPNMTPESYVSLF